MRDEETIGEACQVELFQSAREVGDDLGIGDEATNHKDFEVSRQMLDDTARILLAMQHQPL